MGIVRSIIGFIITTFLLAALYGFGCTAMAFIRGEHDPEATGHYAAAHVYGLVGAVDNEVKSNEARGPSPSLAHQIAAPYALTADVAALLSGKLVNAIASIFRTVDEKAKG